jgi:hypothetical protein
MLPLNQEAAMHGCREIVTFKEKAGVDRAAFKAAAQAVEPVLRTYDGFMGRELIDAGDHFVDLCAWRTRAHADAAVQKSLTDERLAPFFALCDEASVKMIHGAPVG